jgi:hypothetical protein
MKEKNEPQVKYSTFFNKKYKSLPLKIKVAFREARQLFLDNSNFPSLRNHALKENYKVIKVLA